MLGVQLRHRPDREIQMQLLRDRPFWPGGRRQLGDLLESQAIRPGSVPQHQPVLPLQIGPSRWGRLITWPVVQAEELPVELGQRTRVSAVQNHERPFWTPA